MIGLCVSQCLQATSHTHDQAQNEVSTSAIFHPTYGLIGTTLALQNTQETTGNIAVKMSWPESVQRREATTISDAHKSANGDHDMRNYLSQVLDRADSDPDTNVMRVDLSLNPDAGPRPRSRLLRVIVYTHLDTITTLEGKDFVKAWLECVRCKAYFDSNWYQPNSDTLQATMNFGSAVIDIITLVFLI